MKGKVYWIQETNELAALVPLRHCSATPELFFGILMYRPASFLATPT